MSAAYSEKIDDAILRAGAVDYLDLWFVSSLVQDVLGEAEEPSVISTTLETVDRLLQRRWMRAGELRPPGEFEPWPLTPSEAVERIGRELQALERPLSVGDVVWFEIPERWAR